MDFACATGKQYIFFGIVFFLKKSFDAVGKMPNILGVWIAAPYYNLRDML